MLFLATASRQFFVIWAKLKRELKAAICVKFLFDVVFSLSLSLSILITVKKMKFKFFKRPVWKKKCGKFPTCCWKPLNPDDEDLEYDRYDYNLEVFVGNGKIVRINDSKIPLLPVPSEKFKEENEEPPEPLKSKIFTILKKCAKYLRPVALYIMTVGG